MKTETTLANSSSQNVSKVERWISASIGGLAAVFGVQQLLRKNWVSGGLSLAGGAALLQRGATGKCALYKALGVNTAQSSDALNPNGFTVQKTIIIENSPVELFHFWRKLENLPQIMRHLKSVEVLDDGKSHWVADAPLGLEVEWDAEIVDQVENKSISWRSLPGSQIETEGTVSFDDISPDTNESKATKINVNLSYRPPGGVVGVALAKFFGRDAAAEINDDLEIFKHYMESGAFPWDETKILSRPSTLRTN